MRYKDALAHFGSDEAIAEALGGKTRQAVNAWQRDGGIIPEGMAYKLQVITGGRLRVDPRLYDKTKSA